MSFCSTLNLFNFACLSPRTAVVPRLLQASQQEVRDVTAAVCGPCQGVRAGGLREPQHVGVPQVAEAGEVAAHWPSEEWGSESHAINQSRLRSARAAR